MNDGLNLHKKRKRADKFFKKAAGLGLCCILLCFTASLCMAGTIGFQLCAVGAGITLLLGLVFLCLAGAEAQEPYFIEMCETLNDEQLNELKDMLDEAKEKIRKEKEKR